MGDRWQGRSCRTRTVVHFPDRCPSESRSTDRLLGRADHGLRIAAAALARLAKHIKQDRFDQRIVRRLLPDRKWNLSRLRSFLSGRRCCRSVESWGAALAVASVQRSYCSTGSLDVAQADTDAVGTFPEGKAPCGSSDRWFMDGHPGRCVRSLSGAVSPHSKAHRKNETDRGSVVASQSVRVPSQNRPKLNTRKGRGKVRR